MQAPPQKATPPIPDWTRLFDNDEDWLNLEIFNDTTPHDESTKDIQAPPPIMGLNSNNTRGSEIFDEGAPHDDSAKDVHATPPITPMNNTDDNKMPDLYIPDFSTLLSDSEEKNLHGALLEGISIPKEGRSGQEPHSEHQYPIIHDGNSLF